MKRRIRILRVVLRALNLCMSVIVLGIMLNTYLAFVNHRTQTVDGQTYNLWPQDPITWPTYMMLTTSVVSFMFNSLTMTVYCWGVAAANRMDRYGSYWSYFVFAVNTVVWLTTSTTFRMVQGAADEVPPPRDLWGWTCSNAVDALSSEIHTLVNFDLHCQTQVCLPIPYLT